MGSGEQKRKGVVRAPFTANVIQRFMGGSYGALVNKEYIAEYKNWVFACVQARAEEVGNIQLKLLKNGEQISDHPVLDLINSVNPSMTKNDLFEFTQAYKDLDGNAFWYLARDGADGQGNIQAIYILKPDRVRIVISKQNPLNVEGYLYTQPDGQVIPFTPNQILHHKNFDPRAAHPFPHKGMGIVEAASFAIETDNEARKWNLNFFKNGARPDGLLITDGDAPVDQDEYKRIKEEWDEEHRGSDNAFKVSVLSGGLKYQELTRNQKDMDFLGQRTFSRDEILALFRTPKSIIGITDDVNRANADTSVYIFALRTVKPLMQKIVNTLNEFLLPEFGDDLRFEFVSPVPEDRQALMLEYQAGHNKWLSTNDIRRKESLPETENGEELRTVGLSEVIDQTPKPEKQKKIKVPVVKAKKGGIEKIVDKYVKNLPPSKREANIHRKSLDATKKEEYIADWVKRMSSIKPLKNKLNDFFATQEKEVQANLREEMKGLTPKEFKYKAVSDILFDAEKSLSTGISLITPFIQNWLNESGKTGNNAAGGDGFKDDTKPVKDFIDKRAKFFSESINGTTREELLQTITEAKDKGESLDEISKRIAEIYNKAQDIRTDIIARTEVSAASNFGAIEGYKQAGVTEHQWVVVNPEDDDCLMNDGEIVKIGDAFPSGDGEPPIHPNCQCTTVPIFD